MKITFLGTGTSQGVPLIGCRCEVCSSVDSKDKRLRSSVMIEVDGLKLVIDTGPDFRYQMLREKIDHIDAILFTHEHKDHVAGFDDIRGLNFVMQKPMEVYASREVEVALKRDFYYAFGESEYPGVPKLNLHSIDYNPFKIGDVAIFPIKVMHHKMPVMAFRIKDFTYITDANYITEEEKEKIKGSKIIVLNALRKETHISHYTLEEAIALMKELSPEQAYFTHISHQLGKQEEVEKELPDFIRLAYDGLKIIL